MIQPDLKPDPKMITGVLENGLHYYIRPNAEPKGRISLRLRADVGSLYEAENERGLSHFLEHMVFAGSTNFGIDEVIPTIQKKGLMFGRDVNAYTSFEETVYMIDLPDTQEDTIDMSMKLMRDFGDGALFDATRLDRERGVILNELKTRDSADYRVMKQELGFLFEGTKLVDRLPIGLEEVIMNTPRQQFVDYYTRHYSADQLAFVIVGDVTAEEGKKLVEKYFGSAKPSGRDIKPDRGTLKVPTEIRAKIIEEKESPMTNISLSNISPFIDRPDTVASRLEDLPLEMAISMLNRRLEVLSKEESCPFLRAGAYATDVLRTARQVSIGASCIPGNWKASLDVIEQELRRATLYGFTQDEYEEAEQKLIQSAEQAVETWPTRHSDDIADSIIHSIGDHKVFTDPQEELAILIPALGKINPKICFEALAKEWQPDKAQILVTGTVEIAGGEKALLDAYKQSSAVKVEAPSAREIPDFSYEKVGEPGKIAEKNIVEDLGIVQMVLSNGVRVNYKQTDFQSNTIQMVARVNGGSITQPKDTPGLPFYARSIMLGGGLEAHNYDDLVRIMAGKNVGVRFEIADDSFAFSGSTNRKDLETQLKYLCASIIHPGYHKEPDVLFKRSLPTLYKRLSSESEGVLQLNMGKILTGNDYRFCFPSQENLASYTIEDVKNWLDAPLKKNALELSIVGDFDPKELETLLTQTFGALPAREKDRKTPDPASLKVKFNSFGGSDVLTYPTTLDKSLTCVVWKSFDGKDKKRRMKLDLLNQILNIKLFDHIRDKMSDAYSPRAKMEASEYYDGYGLFTALSPGTAENSERVGNAIRAMADEMAKGGITEDDMNRIREPFLATLDKAQRQNGFWLNSALVDSQYKADKLDRFRSYRDDVRKTTVAELKELAKEIFSSSNSILIRVVPEKKEGADSEAEEGSGGDASSETLTVNYADVPREGGYAVLVSESTARDPEWKAIADKLVNAYKGKEFL